MKTITIQVPDDCEVQIVRKEEKKEPVIRTYQDLINNRVNLTGYHISGLCEVKPYNVIAQKGFSEDITASEKVAKSMLAMAQISQLMPYYGGEITDEEWKDENLRKNIIGRQDSKIFVDYNYGVYEFLAFHTAEQRDNFLKYNEQLVKDYLMID